jgi:hypothetical protein
MTAAGIATASSPPRHATACLRCTAVGAVEAQRPQRVDGDGDRVDPLAKAYQQPGKMATGTKVELVRISGMTARSPPIPADSASRTSQPE